MARYLAPTVAMHARKIYSKDQESPDSPNKTRVRPFSFGGKIGQLLCPKVIEQIEFYFKWKMDGRSCQNEHTFSIAFTRK